VVDENDPFLLFIGKEYITPLRLRRGPSVYAGNALPVEVDILLVDIAAEVGLCQDFAASTLRTSV
jgi:hypothetical protein